jgi:hypothetical protein
VGSPNTVVCMSAELQKATLLATECAYDKNAVLMEKLIVPIGKSLKIQCKSIRDLSLIRIPPSPPAH